MALEIERKFKIHVEAFLALPNLPAPKRYRQGYLSFSPAVRVRVTPDESFLTVKGKGLIARQEIEFPIPRDKAEELFTLSQASILKYRYIWVNPVDLYAWEIDRFEESLAGLWLAEIELPAVDTSFDKPSWVLEEVTEDKTYTNAHLARNGLPSRPTSPLYPSWV